MIKLISDVFICTTCGKELSYIADVTGWKHSTKCKLDSPVSDWSILLEDLHCFFFDLIFFFGEVIIIIFCAAIFIFFLSLSYHFGKVVDCLNFRLCRLYILGRELSFLVKASA